MNISVKYYFWRGNLRGNLSNFLAKLPNGARRIVLLYVSSIFRCF